MKLNLILNLKSLHHTRFYEESCDLLPEAILTFSDVPALVHSRYTTQLGYIVYTFHYRCFIIIMILPCVCIRYL